MENANIKFDVKDIVDEKKLQGKVIKLHPTKAHGVIEFMENGMLSTTYFRSYKIRKDGHRDRLKLGDLINFSLKSEEDRIVQDIEIIHNEELQKCFKIYQNTSVFVGFFKRYDENNFYVKEINSYIQFKVKNLSAKHIIPEENSRVKFSLKGKSIRNFKAYLLELVPNKEFDDFRKRDAHEAIITNIDDNCIYVKLSNYNLKGVIKINHQDHFLCKNENIYVIYAGTAKNIIHFKTVF